MLRYKVIVLLAVVALTTADQTLLADGTNSFQELRRFPIQSLDGLLVTNSVLSLDLANSVDGNGSLLIQVAGSSLIGLYDIGVLKVNNGTLHCFAHTKTAGPVSSLRVFLYSEFADSKEGTWCKTILGPSQQWAPIHVIQSIEKGRTPKKMVVGVEISGSGKLWVDDIRICWEQKN